MQAAVLGVPFVDVISTMSDPALPATVTEYEVAASGSLFTTGESRQILSLLPSLHVPLLAMLCTSKISEHDAPRSVFGNVSQ